MSENTLYRKYRPQQFHDLVGQDHIAQTLRNEVQHDQLSHAYLFSGPRGVGKTTTARLLAKVVNCLHPKQGEPDNTCASCLAITQSKTLDIIEIDAASYTGVDNIREVIEHSRFTPSQLKYKVFIIDEVHMLSGAAFNALLKTLEEPPSHVIFIMATTELHKVPETILSRCQRFDFHRLSDADLGTRLRSIAKAEKHAIDDGVLDSIIRIADGSSRDAESILGQLFALSDKRITQAEADVVLPRSNMAAVADLILAILQNNQAQALATIAKQLNDGVDLETFRVDCIRLLRDCLLYTLVQPSSRPNLPATLHDPLAKTSAQTLVRALEAFLNAAQYVSVSPLPQLPLELAVLQSTFTSLVPATPPAPTAVVNEPTSPVKEKTAPKSDGTLWQRIVDDVATRLPSLASSLHMVRVVREDNQALHLAGPYALHVERLNQPTVLQTVQDLTEKIGGKKLQVTIAHDPSVTLDVKPTITHNTPEAIAPTTTATPNDQMPL